VDIYCNLLAVSKVGPLESLSAPTTEMLLLISEGFSQGIALLSARFTFIGHRWNASTILWPTDRLILSERDATAHTFIFFFEEPRVFFHIDKSMKETY
jgi:dTDP-4-dehydrorhamnose 3,5-epimerase-like enzyme